MARARYSIKLMREFWLFARDNKAYWIVPLVMLLPGVAPQVVDVRIDHRDVKPTLLSYLGIRDATSKGRDLLPLLRQRASALEARPVAPAPKAPPDGDGPAMRPELEEALRDLGYID